MAPVINGISHVTALEAAEQLETTETRILMLLRANTLKGVELEGEWFVEKGSLDCARTNGIELKVAKGCASHCTASSCGCK